MATRVLFADDQAPWRDPARDAAVRDEIVRVKGAKLRAAGKDPIAAFEEDHRWFADLLHHLRTVEGFEVVTLASYSEAEQEIRRVVAGHVRYDAIVIDLSWSGDAALPADQRDNVGLNLIRLAAPRSAGTPVIAFSQNFLNEKELVRTVTTEGALPIQKHYTEVDANTLAAAIHHLANRYTPAAAAGAPAADGNVTFWGFVLRTVPQRYAAIGLVGAVLLLWAAAHLAAGEGGAVKLLGLPLYDRAPAATAPGPD